MLSKQSRYLLLGLAGLIVVVIIGIVIWKHHSGSSSGPQTVCSGNGSMSCNCVPPFMGDDCSTGLTGKYYMTFPSQPADKMYVTLQSNGGTYPGPKEPASGDKLVVISFENNANNNLIIAYYGSGDSSKKYLAPLPGGDPLDVTSWYFGVQITNATSDPQKASEFKLIPVKGGYALQYTGKWLSSVLGIAWTNTSDVEFFNSRIAPFIIPPIVFEPVQ